MLFKAALHYLLPYIFICYELIPVIGLLSCFHADVFAVYFANVCILGTFTSCCEWQLINGVKMELYLFELTLFLSIKFVPT